MKIYFLLLILLSVELVLSHKSTVKNEKESIVVSSIKEYVKNKNLLVLFSVVVVSLPSVPVFLGIILFSRMFK